MLAGVSLGLSIGLQTLKERYPLMIASFVVLKNSTFSFFWFSCGVCNSAKKAGSFYGINKNPLEGAVFFERSVVHQVVRQVYGIGGIVYEFRI
jgi:hypothetical protein